MSVADCSLKDFYFRNPCRCQLQQNEFFFLLKKACIGGEGVALSFSFNTEALLSFSLTATAGMSMSLNWFYQKPVWLDMWTSNLF